MREGKMICCLIAKVESPEQRKEFYVGKGLTFKAPLAGRLYLGVADWCNRDNSGAFSVKVEVDGKAVDFRTLTKQR